MRQILLTISCFVVYFSVSAQEGIQFKQGSWKEMLSMAKKENKLVFVDVYTSWCGPCKQMVAKVFPQKKVGEFFNSSFVNYKLDAEKGEGIDLARNYAVKAFPTYLFVNGDGQLVYKLTGYNEAELFLAEAAIAVKEQRDPKPFAVWQSEYESGKRDKDFMLGYLYKRSLLKLPSADLIEASLPLLNEKEWLEKKNLGLIFYYDANIQFKPGGRLYGFILHHHAQIDSLMERRDGYSAGLLQYGIRNYFFKQIVPAKEEDMLAVTIRASDSLASLLHQNDRMASSRRWAMDYYSRTGQVIQLEKATRDYVYDGLFKQDTAAMMAADVAEFNKFLAPYLQGTSDSAAVKNWSIMRRINQHRSIIDWSYHLRDAAEDIYQHSTDAASLKEAVAWARLSAELFPHFSNQAVYAALLFKTGTKKAAIEEMQEAAKDEILMQNNEVRQLLESNAASMSADKAPQKVW